jgi:transposase
MAKKGQTYTPYTEELKRKVVRLKLEEGCSYRQLRGRFDIQSDAQIAEWVRKVQNKEAFEDHCGIWNRKQFFGHRREICHDNKLLFSFIPVKLISLIFPFLFYVLAVPAICHQNRLTRICIPVREDLFEKPFFFPFFQFVLQLR